MKITWQQKGKVVEGKGTLDYYIRPWGLGLYFRCGLDDEKFAETTLEAMQRCQSYEDKL